MCEPGFLLSSCHGNEGEGPGCGSLPGAWALLSAGGAARRKNPRTPPQFQPHARHVPVPAHPSACPLSSCPPVPGAACRRGPGNRGAQELVHRRTASRGHLGLTQRASGEEDRASGDPQPSSSARVECCLAPAGAPVKLRAEPGWKARGAAHTLGNAGLPRPSAHPELPPGPTRAPLTRSHGRVSAVCPAGV